MALDFSALAKLSFVARAELRPRGLNERISTLRTELPRPNAEIMS